MLLCSLESNPNPKSNRNLKVTFSRMEPDYGAGVFLALLGAGVHSSLMSEDNECLNA